MMALMGIVATLTMTVADAKPLPRIAVRNGRFVNTATGREMRPCGFNYIRLRVRGTPPNTYLWHDTFNPTSYDPDRAERMFREISKRGFNLVRVFLDPSAGEGFVEREGANELSPRYLANLFDFLKRARANRVYVMLCFCYLPPRASYSIGRRVANVEGGNTQYLHPDYVQAKARWMADVCAAIKAHEPGLLSTVFSYELENESHFIATQAPFSLRGAVVQWGGKSYDTAKAEDLQRLADDAIVTAIDAAERAVRAVDRQALVGASVFTFRAVGRSGPARLTEDRTPDNRFPARPLAIARSRSAYVDVHFYPTGDGTIDEDYRSIEFEELHEACKRAGKPMIVGEIGAFKFAFKTLESAADAMERSIGRLFRDGWKGFLYWTYDNEEQREQLWEATAGGGELLRALERVTKKGA